MIASQRLVELFRVRAKEINCAEITELQLKATSKRRMASQMVKFFSKGGPIVCFRLSADYAQIAFDTIDHTLAENHVDAPNQPTSCTAMLAKKMGVSEMHVVMAAGLAGGIGLSGGACGVLGAAMWIKGINILKNNGKIIYDPNATSDVFDKFLESSDYEFECAKIVGRKFENVADHASYLRAGGCAKIIEALSASS